MCAAAFEGLEGGTMIKREAFAIEVATIDNGRFAHLVDALPLLGDNCKKCNHFNPHINDPGKGFRCRCMGSCPAATLHPELQAYIWRHL
jgi:hypothetical protein